jgi:hypothetical protein|uniref:hypothetical protein n=1 Tax=Fluviicola sp. TaxID=1917219 RepID=UPI00404A0125
MKRIIYSLPLFLLTACGEPDTICDCIAVSDSLNIKSRELLNKVPTAADEQAIQTLRKQKKQTCAAFEKMGGAEMLERKKTCNE